jgi:hypothetical protein
MHASRACAVPQDRREPLQGDASETSGRGSTTVSPDIPRGPMDRTVSFARQTAPEGLDASPGRRNELRVALGTNAIDVRRRFGLQ